jgi:signal transduction histidine kinase
MNKVLDQNNINFAEDLAYQSKLLAASFAMRLINLSVAIIFFLVVKNIIGVHLPIQALVTYGIWIIVSLTFLFIFAKGLCRTRRVLDNLHFGYYFVGIVLSASVAYYFGGAEGVAFFVFLFDLIYANVLLTRGRGAIVTLYAVLFYFGIIFLDFNGIIPHHRVFDPSQEVFTNLKYVFTTSVIAIGGTFFLISYATGLFSKMKINREISLIESRKRMLTKTDQLEEMNRELIKNIAENRYIKRAAMGYVEKKEFELSQTKKDLEEQIEKLRRTQKSMFFMIEDLNEMSSQLRETRNHLEDKVRERTDELLNINQKLHRSERLAFLGRLSGSVTHELRNPLAVLKNAAYYLERNLDKKKDENTLKYINIVAKEISIIDRIIDDIMGFAKTAPPELEETEMDELVEEAVLSLNVPELVEIKRDFNKVPRIRIDRNQVKHAIVNIINNAIMAMSGNGNLNLRINEESGNVCVYIEDTGPGIPPEQKNLIFEPLYSSKPKGTGLGLPIAKMMIENQGGTIEFTSKLGKGTVFKISLPLEDKAKKAGKNKAE